MDPMLKQQTTRWIVRSGDLRSLPTQVTLTPHPVSYSTLGSQTESIDTVNIGIFMVFLIRQGPRSRGAKGSLRYTQVCLSTVIRVRAPYPYSTGFMHNYMTYSRGDSFSRARRTSARPSVTTPSILNRRGHASLQQLVCSRLTKNRDS